MDGQPIIKIKVANLLYNLPSTAWPVRVATVNMCGSGWPVKNTFIFFSLVYLKE